MDKNGFIAATKFGMGVRPDDEEIIFREPKKWLLAQLDHPDDNLLDFSSLSSSQENVVKLLQARKSGDEDQKKEMRRDFKEIALTELRAKVHHAAGTRTPFYERLVDFWSNHFTVSVKKGPLAGLAGSFEREVIRPNVCGNFTDMLIASTHHPAMLLYLDNAGSSGPDSKAGVKRGIGLNENLAREIMELHTLGVDGGYNQEDVTNFAKILTGWGIGRLDSNNPGAFEFAANRHEPGPITLLGTTYPDAGEQQAVSALQALAAHPATAEHIALKLAKHFISDNPPRPAVEKLRNAFTQTGGNLKAVYLTLMELPEAWDFAHPKIKSSYDLVISAARLCSGNNNLNVDYCLQSLKFLGNIPFTADSPAGFSDNAADLTGPEEVLRRVEWAQLAAVKLTPAFGYQQLTLISIAPIMSEQTRDLLGSVLAERQGLALLLASPEFQKR